MKEKLRDYILLYINNKEYKVFKEKSFQMLSDYLRYEVNLTGTKVVCAEGDCGACTVQVADLKNVKDYAKLKYKIINACIMPIYNLDGYHVVTVEGVNQKLDLHPVQIAMINKHGSQCGYCTPGFVNALVNYYDFCLQSHSQVDRKKASNYLTGNLCRCTGYRPILDSVESLNLVDSTKTVATVAQRFHSDLTAVKTEVLNQSVMIESEHKTVFLPRTLTEALDHKQQYPDAKLISGATDLGVLINKDKVNLCRIISLNQVEELKKINISNEKIILGAQVTVAEFEKALQQLNKQESGELQNLLHIFASPQIKNAATVLGNILNASPIADLIPAMMLMDAVLLVNSKSTTRQININDFYLGYKKLNLRADELVVGIEFNLPKNFYKLYKVSLRKDLDISALTMAASVQLQNEQILDFKLIIGGVAATVLRLTKLEAMAKGKVWNQEIIDLLKSELVKEIHPLSDVRGSKEYRLKLAQNLLQKFYLHYERNSDAKNLLNQRQQLGEV